MEQEKLILLIGVVVAVILLIAIYVWEMREMHLVEDCQSVDDVPEDQKVAHLQDLACYHYTTKVVWRQVVIGTIIATLVIYVFLYKKMHMDITTTLVIAFIILATFMVLGIFNNFHYDRVVCQKAASQAPWFQRLAHLPDAKQLFPLRK